VDHQSDITVKIYEHDDIKMLQHVIIFFNLHGKDPQTYQTNTYIEWDKNSGVSKQDPNGIFKSVTSSVKYDGKIAYVTFHITPKNTLDTSHIIIRAWDTNLSQNQVVVLNAINIGYIPKDFSSAKP
jgi:hypothetical protein